MNNNITSPPNKSQLATVTSNGTICIPKKIRQQLNIKAKDKIYFYISTNNQILLVKPPSTIKEFVGHGKDTFKALGNGENFLKQERSLWK